MISCCKGNNLNEPTIPTSVIGMDYGRSRVCHLGVFKFISNIGYFIVTIHLHTDLGKGYYAIVHNNSRVSVESSQAVSSCLFPSLINFYSHVEYIKI